MARALTEPARGLVELRTGGRWPTAHFTEAGLAALRELARDRRALDPARYAHVRRELGLDPAAEGGSGDEGADGAVGTRARAGGGSSP